MLPLARKSVEPLAASTDPRSVQTRPPSLHHSWPIQIDRKRARFGIGTSGRRRSITSRMEGGTIDEDRFLVRQGDTAGAPSGISHYVQVHGLRSLQMLCCCVPAYCAEDVELLEPDSAADVVSLNELAEFSDEIKEEGTEEWPLPLLVIEDGIQAKTLRRRLR